MNAQDLKNSILQRAIEGKLVPQRAEEGTARDLLAEIRAEKEKLIKAKLIKKTQPLSEITDDEKPFDIPDSWEWVRLEEIGSIIGGGTPKTQIIEYWDGTIPWITPADMKFIGKYAKRGKRNISSLGLQKSSAQLMPKGTVLFSSRAPIGYIAIADNDISTNQGFKSIVPFDMRCNEYIYYCLQARISDIKHRASGTTFKEISGGEFGKTMIPLPPLDEQHRIIARIEELQPDIDAYDKAHTELRTIEQRFPDDMKKSLLQYAIEGKLVPQRKEEGTARDLLVEIHAEKEKLIKEKKIKKTKPLPEITDDEKPFDIPDSWEWVRLGNVGNLVRGSGIKRSDIILSGKPCIRYGELYTTYRTRFSSAVSQTSKDVFCKSKKVHQNDILMALTGENKWDIALAVVYEGTDEIAMGGDMTKWEYHGMNPIYLAMVINSPYGIACKRNMATGDIIVHISNNKLSEIMLPIPPLAEQHRIVARIEELLPFCRQLLGEPV
jgi:type I restriction enzyme S subunit